MLKQEVLVTRFLELVRLPAETRPCQRCEHRPGVFDWSPSNVGGWDNRTQVRCAPCALKDLSRRYRNGASIPILRHQSKENCALCQRPLRTQKRVILPNRVYTYQAPEAHKVCMESVLAAPGLEVLVALG